MSHETAWNPHYLAYVAAEGVDGDPEATLRRDRERWSCGCMLGFILWASRNPPSTDRAEAAR